MKVVRAAMPGTKLSITGQLVSGTRARDGHCVGSTLSVNRHSESTTRTQAVDWRQPTPQKHPKINPSEPNHLNGCTVAL